MASEFRDRKPQLTGRQTKKVSSQEFFGKSELTSKLKTVVGQFLGIHEVTLFSCASSAELPNMDSSQTRGFLKSLRLKKKCQPMAGNCGLPSEV